MAVVNSIPDTLANFQNPGAQLAQKWAADNGTWLAKLIEEHKAWIKEAGIAKYQAAYDGDLEEIRERNKSRGDDVNNKLQTNYAALIIDTCVDYMLGKPIVWATEIKDEAQAKQLEKTLDEYKNDIIELLQSAEGQRVLAEQLRQGSLAGYSPVIGWVDEDGEIDYEEFPVQEVIPVYDVRGRLQLVIRYYPYEIPLDGGETQQRTRVEVYDERYVTYYLSDETNTAYTLDDGELDEAMLGNPVEHFAGRIPVSIFTNGVPASYEKRQKRNGVSDLANGVLTLLINYASVMSDKANTVDRTLDQYLTLIGVDIDEGEVLKMRKARALALKAKDSKAAFIAPAQEDTAVENHLKRVKDAIHETTGTPQLNELAGATATEIKMRYGGLDIKAGKKELYFTGAIRQLVAVLTDMLNARRLVAAKVDRESIYDILTGQQKPPASVVLYDPKWLTWTINRNLPQNFKEISEIVKNLAGIVPDSYLYELLWFIDDPAAALEEIKQQKAEEAKLGLKGMGFDTGTEVTGSQVATEMQGLMDRLDAGDKTAAGEMRQLLSKHLTA